MGIASQAPKNVDEAIDAMANRYVGNETLRAIKDDILKWTTIVLAIAIAVELGRRYGAWDMLSSLGVWSHRLRNA